MTMYHHIFVEHQPERGYVATALGWPECVGIGSTKEEAIAQVCARLTERLARGEIVRVPAGESPPGDPWERVIGQFVDDPHWDEFQDELRRLREEANRA